MILGAAIASGLERYNLKHSDAAMVAMRAAEEAQALAIKVGREVPEKHTSQWERLPYRAEAGVNQYVGLADANEGLPPGLPAGTKIVAVERGFGPEGGWSRPDMEVDDGFAPDVPLDFKVTLSGGEKKQAEFNRDRRIGRWSQSGQLLNYVSYLSKKTAPFWHYYIGDIVLEPKFSFEIHRFNVHPETLTMWETTVKQTWKDMEDQDDGKRTIEMAFSHADEYGECPMKRACFEHHLDPQLMSGDYIRLPRMPWRG
jgi:hypothetical protein